jgi:CTP synthase (UTP-ammonia lyase)
MSRTIRIAVIGDYNFTYNSHHATNLALDHASYFLDIEISYYWIKLQEASQLSSNQLKIYDGIWIAPGPYKNDFFLGGIVDFLIQQHQPVFITGEGYKTIIDVLIARNNLNLKGEKLISDNLVEGQQFEEITIIPHSKELIQLYENHNTSELTSSRFSLYPKVLNYLVDEFIHIEAYNQFEEVEVISLANRNFYLACGFCPQISSTREIPHPLIYTFIKACMLQKGVEI